MLTTDEERIYYICLLWLHCLNKIRSTFFVSGRPVDWRNYSLASNTTMNSLGFPLLFPAIYASYLSSLWFCFVQMYLMYFYLIDIALVELIVRYLHEKQANLYSIVPPFWLSSRKRPFCYALAYIFPLLLWMLYWFFSKLYPYRCHWWYHSSLSYQ